MAEGYEAFHVPQQSRREKLRVGGAQSLEETHLQSCAAGAGGGGGGLLLPLYDPSDFLTCATSLKEEGVNFMGCTMDPQSSLILNPGPIPGLNPNPFLYNHNTPQNFRILDHHHHQAFNGGEGILGFSTAPEPTANGQGLSLSLSNSHYNNNNNNNNNMNTQLSNRRYESSSVYRDKVTVTGGCNAIPVAAVESVPLGPFTGYASVLKGSRFLRPAQQLLEELYDVGKCTVDSSLMEESPMEGLGGTGIEGDHNLDSGARRKKSRLISMLEEVYSRYKQYYQQIQAVVASFQSVAGLNNAAPYVNLALKAMSKHFRCLKNAIIDQLQFASKVRGHVNYQKDESPRFGNPDRSFYGQGQITNSGFQEHHQPVWRPQRGLPECAVTVLRAWLFEHFLHPYPTDTDKLMLAKQTGLSRSQVSNWFINARVRLWKPMVEEIHMLETRQAQKGSMRNADGPPHGHLPPMNSLVSEIPSTSCPRTTTQDLSSKRTRSEMSMGGGGEDPMTLSYENFSHHNQPRNGVGTASRGVSLTLGLHHSSNGMVLQDPFRVTEEQRFGINSNGEGYMIAGGGFDSTNQQFGREIMGGQHLHDFVG